MSHTWDSQTHTLDKTSLSILGKNFIGNAQHNFLLSSSYKSHDTSEQFSFTYPPSLSALKFSSMTKTQQ